MASRRHVGARVGSHRRAAEWPRSLGGSVPFYPHCLVSGTLNNGYAVCLSSGIGESAKRLHACLPMHKGRRSSSSLRNAILSRWRPVGTKLSRGTNADMRLSHSARDTSTHLLRPLAYFSFIIHIHHRDWTLYSLSTSASPPHFHSQGSHPARCPSLLASTASAVRRPAACPTSSPGRAYTSS